MKDTVELVFTETSRMAGQMTDRMPAYASMHARKIMAELLGLERLEFKLDEHGSIFMDTTTKKSI